MSAWTRLARLGDSTWRWLRAVSGDDAYEAYVSRSRRPSPLPTREEFYLETIRRKYSRLSRCC